MAAVLLRACGFNWINVLKVPVRNVCIGSAFCKREESRPHFRDLEETRNPLRFSTRMSFTRLFLYSSH